MFGNGFSDWLGEVQWGTLGDWAAAIGTVAAVGVAVWQTQRATKAGQQARTDALMARQEAEKDFLLQEAQESIRWKSYSSLPFGRKNEDGNMQMIAFLYNESSRAIHDVMVTLVINGEPWGLAQPMGPNRDGSGTIPARTGNGQAWLDTPYVDVPSMPETDNVQTRATFQMDKYHFTINEWNEVTIH
jgi:hypothetical protein